MVIYNARRRMNEREASNWDNKLDPGVLLKELVDLLRVAIKHDAVRPTTAPRRSRHK